jgi:hypothetical protein
VPILAIPLHTVLLGPRGKQISSEVLVVGERPLSSEVYRNIALEFQHGTLGSDAAVTPASRKALSSLSIIQADKQFLTSS